MDKDEEKGVLVTGKGYGAVATDEEESAVATSAVENAEADDVAAGSSGSPCGGE